MFLSDENRPDDRATKAAITPCDWPTKNMFESSAWCEDSCLAQGRYLERGKRPMDRGPCDRKGMRHASLPRDSSVLVSSFRC